MDKLDLIWGILGALGVTLLGIWAWAIQRHIAATTANTVQIAVLGEKVSQLQATIEHLKDTLVLVQTLKRDVDYAHEKIRELKRPI